MKILLFGAHGQVGTALAELLPDLGTVTALHRNLQEDLIGDLIDLNGLTNTIRKIRPDVIINAAAYTAVDLAESEPDLAHSVNAAAPAAMARAAKDCGALLVHYSSDYVFDGSGSTPWSENDDCAPLNIYGHTKLAGDIAILQSGCRHLIFRTSWVYAETGKNFINTILRLAQEREELKVVADQYGTPTSAAFLAQQTIHAIKEATANPALEGLYHLTPRGTINWHGYAELILDVAREIKLPVITKRIEPVASATFPTPATRPLNSRLGSSKFEQAFGQTLPSWENEVRQTIIKKTLAI